MKTKKNETGLNETILGWFKRTNPEELWAVGRMPESLTFRDLEKSMANGDGEGVAGECTDTRTRELMNGRLAELLGKTYDELIDWANDNIREKRRSDYRANCGLEKRQPKKGEVENLVKAAEKAIGELAAALAGIDKVALAGQIGSTGLFNLRNALRRIDTKLGAANRTLGECEDFA